MLSRSLYDNLLEFVLSVQISITTFITEARIKLLFVIVPYEFLSRGRTLDKIPGEELMSLSMGALSWMYIHNLQPGRPFLCDSCMGAIFGEGTKGGGIYKRWLRYKLMLFFWESFSLIRLYVKKLPFFFFLIFGRV